MYELQLKFLERWLYRDITAEFYGAVLRGMLGV